MGEGHRPTRKAGELLWVPAGLPLYPRAAALADLVSIPDIFAVPGQAGGFLSSTWLLTLSTFLQVSRFVVFLHNCALGTPFGLSSLPLPPASPTMAP